MIGASIAFELAKRGYKTLNIDKLPASGYGPTSNSCAIVRAHYSSREGVAMAYEGFFYWQDWDTTSARRTTRDAKYMQCGTCCSRARPATTRRSWSHFRDLGVEYEEWDNGRTEKRSRLLDAHAFWPPKRPDDPRFWDEPERSSTARSSPPAPAT